MSFKVKDRVRVISDKFEASGEVSSIIEGKVYSIKYHNPAIDEIDMYWIKPDDIVEEYISGFTSDSVLDDPGLICASSADCSISLSANPVNTSPSSSLRFNSGKISLSEIDPIFIKGMGEVLTKSRVKYPKFNWQLDTKLSTPMDSLERHWLSFKGGEDIDPDDQMYHLYKVAVNAMFIMFHLRNNPEKSDDRGFKGKK